MIQRYLGNKKSLAENIIKEISRFCTPGDFVCDIFSGTVSMSLALKNRGFRVISNDISLFSYHFANAYLKNYSIPAIDLNALNINQESYNNAAMQRLFSCSGKKGYDFLNDENHLERYRKLVVMLEYLEKLQEDEIRKSYRAHYFYDTYTEEGKNSAFRSLRGASGKRRFFTPQNAVRLDNIMNKLREWRQDNLLEDCLYSMLLCIVCESLEKVSNTQGTYHDFPRNYYDSRAFKPLTLQPPPMDVCLSSSLPHIIGKAEDSMEFINVVPKHRLLYLDPPYNFRQYTSYYFMLNLIASYCEIDDLENYFSRVRFVRGQNMDSDFTSSFCKAAQFLPSLRELISRADTEYVVMSYFNARNHANKGTETDNRSIEKIEAFFQSDLFVPGSYELKSFVRSNYQSHQGCTAKKCSEFLFIAQKR